MRRWDTEDRTADTDRAETAGTQGTAEKGTHP